jgi:hypothetical protein
LALAPTLDCETLPVEAQHDFALQAGFSQRAVATAEDRARLNATSFFTELAVLGAGFEQRLYAAVARRCGLRFAFDVDPDALVIDPRDTSLAAHGLAAVHMIEPGGRLSMVLAPPPETLAGFLARGPHAAQDRLRSVVVAPRTLGDALIERTAQARLEAAVGRLAQEQPALSARFAFSGWQGWFIGVVLSGMPAVWLLFPAALEVLLHVSVSVFFFSCVLIRFLASIGTTGAPALAPLAPFRRADMPRYAVLVAAYREQAVAAQLVRSLSRLKWPPSKLEVFLVCEADDRETVMAFEAAGLPPHMRIVTVPEGGPRTKPKALMTVLPLVRAEYLVLYDAEDHPHPEQLIEAWQAFKASPRIACVQAPLEITNGSRSLIARLFAFEYAAIFRGLLPHLARHGRYVPLGGTSNHFDGIR